MYRNKHKLSLELPITQDTADNDLEGAPFVSVQNIVNIKQGKLCLPDDRMHIAFVQKKEKNSTASEIKIYRLIASYKHYIICIPIININNLLPNCLSIHL